MIVEFIHFIISWSNLRIFWKRKVSNSILYAVHKSTMNEKELMKLKSFAKSRKIIEYERQNTQQTNPQLSDAIIGPFGSNLSVESAKFPRSNETIRTATSKRRLSAGSNELVFGEAIRQEQRYNDEYERIRGSGPKSNLSDSAPNRKDLLTGNLEYWWTHSPFWRRIIPQIFIICFLLGLVHLVVGITLILEGCLNHEAIEDPYVCRTEQCKETGIRTKTSMNTSADPCTDFYDFVCGNYVQNFTLDNPKEPTFLRTKTSYRKGNILASILKRTKSKNLLNFYKSCLNTPRRNKRKLEPFYEIMEKEVKMFDPNTELSSIAAKITRVAGRYGLFRYRYGKGSTIIFDTSPVKSQFNFLSSPESHNELETLFTELLPMVRKLNTVNGNPLFSGNDTSLILNSRNQLIALATCWNALHGNSPNTPSYNEQSCRQKGKLIFDFYKAVEEAEGIVLTKTNAEFANVDTKNFVDLDNGRIGLLSCCITQSLTQFSTDKQENIAKMTYKLYYMMNAFRRFTINLHTAMQNLIEKQIPQLFLNERRLKQHSIATQCMFSASYDYGAIFLIELSKVLYNSTLKPEKMDFVYTIFDVIHRWLAKGELDDLILPEHIDLFDKFVSRKRRVNFVTYNYASYQDYLIPEFKDFRPNVKEYYLNCWTGRQLFHKQRNSDWKIGNNIDWIASGRDVFERLNIDIDPLYPTNQITIPIPLMRPPYVNNDHRGLDFAGLGVMLTRAILEIPKTSLDSGDSFPTIANPTDESICGNCSFPYESPECSCKNLHGEPAHCYTFYNKEREQFLTTLSIRVAYELLKNSSDFPVLIKKNELEEKVAIPSYDASETGHIEAYRYIETDSKGRLVKIDYLLKSQVEPRKSRVKYKLQYKTLVAIEQFDPDQLFFVVLVRHHCYAPNIKFKTKFNSAIAQIEGFTKAFKCKPNDLMSYERSRCFV